MNGISLLLDAETFDYAYPIEVYEGFQMRFLKNNETKTLAW